MASIKVKLRPSSVHTKEGTLYYQVIHNRITRQIKTEYKLFPIEWDSHSAEIILPLLDGDRKNDLLALKEKVKEDASRLKNAIAILNQKGEIYTSDSIVSFFLTPTAKNYLFAFSQDVISNLRQLGQFRTSETYTATLNSFMRFRKGEDIPLHEIRSDMMIAYGAYLRAAGLSMNTSSFYMRNLRAVYNRAVEKELIAQRYPFKHVYTGIDKTVKRAVSIKVIKQIKELDLTLFPVLDYARDMFMFSFYTRGMSFIDLAYLEKRDLKNGILSYRRKKTGQQLFIKWESYMQELVNKYLNSNSPYLLPIVKRVGENERQQYKNASHLVNCKLKTIGSKLDLSTPLTMYVARHAWASIAKSKNIPISVISESMGHDSEITTQIYLASLDTVAVDNANSLIMRSLLV